MRRTFSPSSSRPGFLLLEVLLGIVVFSMFLGAVGLTLVSGQQNTVTGGDRIRAVAAAQQGVEATRSVRDGSFASLTTGAHGVALGPARTWIFSGSQVRLNSGYTTAVTVTSIASDWVGLSSAVKWRNGIINRSGSIVIQSELTDWRGTRGTGDWSTASLQGSYIDASNVSFNDVVVSGNYAFVSSDTSSGGAGLYVFDISTLSSPTRVASSFSLGAAGYGMAVKGKTLYIVTGDAAAEVRAYDITTPSSLSAAKLRTSYNLSGSSLATSLALRGNTLLVGSTLDATYGELSSFDVSNTGAIVPRSSLQVSASVNAVALSGTGVYLATSDSAAEMKVASVTSTGALQYPPVTDVNLSSTEIGRSMAVSGTAALLGRQKGAIQELTLFNTRVTPGGSPGPWYHEGSGSLVGVDMDPSECYAFLAADSSIKAMQIVNIRDTVSLPELTTYNSVSGPARGLFYDIVRDRLFVLTRKGFLIFQPGSSTSVCS